MSEEKIYPFKLSYWEYHSLQEDDWFDTVWEAVGAAWAYEEHGTGVPDTVLSASGDVVLNQEQLAKAIKAFDSNPSDSSALEKIKD